MPATKGTAPLYRSGAEKNHDSLISMARDWFARNPGEVQPRAAQDLARTLKQFAEAIEEFTGQLEEPGFASFPHDNLFNEGAGLSREQADTLVLYYVESITDLHVGNLATAVEAWLRKEIEREVKA